MVFKGFEAGKGGSTGNQLMTKAGLVLVVIVDLIVSVVRFT